jgi:nicotinamidase-related amidase
MTKEILLIIDPQKDFTDINGDYAQRHPHIHQIIDAKNKIIGLTNATDKNKVVVIFSDYTPNQFGENLSMCIPGTAGHEIDIPVDDTFHLFSKTRHSAFSSEAFTSFLKTNQINKLILCGFLAEYCIKATATDALERGYQVCLLEDCIGTGDDVQDRKQLMLDDLKNKNVEIINSLK